MKVELEKFDQPGGILRVWIDRDAKHGQPYQLAMSVRWLSEDTIEFLGLQQPFAGPMAEIIQAEAAAKGITIDDAVIEFLRSRKPISFRMWRAIQDEVASHGITRIKAVRYNTGVERVEWIETKRRRRN